MSSRSTVGRPLLVGVVVVAAALVWSVGGPGLPGPYIVPVDSSAGVGVPEVPLEHGLEDDLLAEVRESTAHVHGLGCIAAQVGTGFVAGPDLVVTAAHVVAGLDAPIVDIGGVSTPSIVVAFDPRSDLAVLSTAVGLPPALPLADASAGQTVALVAYDDEGNPATSAVRIGRLIFAVGDDIYGDPADGRAALELTAEVVYGNSGGPLVDGTGAVVGVLFSRVRGGRAVAYAVQSAEVLELLAGLDAGGTLEEVGSGPCRPR